MNAYLWLAVCDAREQSFIYFDPLPGFVNRRFEAQTEIADLVCLHPLAPRLEPQPFPFDGAPRTGIACRD